MSTTIPKPGLPVDLLHQRPELACVSVAAVLVQAVTA